MTKILLAGPWMGEFGWQLFCWQGYIRTLSKQYDKTIIACNPNERYIYHDFANEYIDYIVKEIDASSSKTHGHVLDMSKFKDVQYNRWVTPREIHDVVDGVSTEYIKPTYICYGNRLKEKTIDILIHARHSLKNLKTEGHRNWTSEYLEELVNKLPNLKMVFCGTKSGSLSIPGYDDYRDASLEELTIIMNQSKVCVGQSSGTMHYASLNKVPHVVCFGKQDGFKDNTIRYKYEWNPFKTDVITINSSWSPNTDDFSNCIKEFLEELYEFK